MRKVSIVILLILFVVVPILALYWISTMPSEISENINHNEVWIYK
jgi:uncharacterized protein YqfA (UPF0365 family)